MAWQFNLEPSLHSVTRHGGVASLNIDKYKNYVQEFRDYIKT